MIYTNLKANADHFTQIYSGSNGNSTRTVTQGGNLIHATLNQINDIDEIISFDIAKYQALILLYDVTSQISFDFITHYLNYARNIRYKRTCLVGLIPPNHQERVITIEKA